MIDIYIYMRVVTTITLARGRGSCLGIRFMAINETNKLK